MINCNLVISLGLLVMGGASVESRVVTPIATFKLPKETMSRVDKCNRTENWTRTADGDVTQPELNADQNTEKISNTPYSYETIHRALGNIIDNGSDISVSDTRTREAKSYPNYRRPRYENQFRSGLDRSESGSRLKFSRNGAVDDDHLSFLYNKNRLKLIEKPIGPYLKRNERLDRIFSHQNQLREHNPHDDSSNYDNDIHMFAHSKNTASKYGSEHQPDIIGYEGEQDYGRIQGRFNYDDVLTQEKRLTKMIENGHPLLRPIGRSNRRTVTVSPDIIPDEQQSKATAQPSVREPQSLPMHPKYESLKIANGVPQVAEVKLKSPDYYEKLFIAPKKAEDQAPLESERIVAPSASHHQFEFRYHDDPSSHIPGNAEHSASNFDSLSQKAETAQRASQGSSVNFVVAPPNTDSHRTKTRNQHRSDMYTPSVSQAPDHRDYVYMIDNRYSDPILSPELENRLRSSLRYDKDEPRSSGAFSEESPELYPSQYQHNYPRHFDKHYLIHERVNSYRNLPSQRRRSTYQIPSYGEDLYEYSDVQKSGVSGEYRLPDRKMRPVDSRGDRSNVNLLRKESRRKLQSNIGDNDFRMEKRNSYPSLNDVFHQMSATREMKSPHTSRSGSSRYSDDSIYYETLDQHDKYVNYVNDDDLYNPDYHDENQYYRSVSNDYDDSFSKPSNDRSYSIAPSLQKGRELGNRYPFNDRRNYKYVEHESFDDKPSGSVTRLFKVPPSKMSSIKEPYLRNREVSQDFSEGPSFQNDRPYHANNRIPIDKWDHGTSSTPSEGVSTFRHEHANHRIRDDSRIHEGTFIPHNDRYDSENNEHTRTYAPGQNWNDFSSEILQDVRSHRSDRQDSRKIPIHVEENIHYPHHSHREHRTHTDRNHNEYYPYCHEHEESYNAPYSREYQHDSPYVEPEMRASNEQDARLQRTPNSENNSRAPYSHYY